ncbi:MAG: RNA polymerase sigma-70 factor [Tannerella sp.]|jgi:RNA polymerase sigma-70 factor (ECF subfamily)|nr:RNA polymerase sigma-70 factor [Tannerella sp.]
MSGKFHIPASKTGDVRLFEEVFNTYYSVLCNYAASIIKDQSMAEDVVSDMFLNLWEGRDHLMIETSLKSYLFKSTYNQCLNALKHVQVENQYRDFFLHHSPLSEDGTDYPLSGIIENEIYDILQKTLEQLPEQCRKIFIMSRINGMKHEEIAQELGISINTVRTQIHRALEKLRVELKDYLPFLLPFINLLDPYQLV